MMTVEGVRSDIAPGNVVRPATNVWIRLTSALAGGRTRRSYMEEKSSRA